MRHLVILTIALVGLLAVAACTPATTNTPTGNPSTGAPATTTSPVASTPAASTPAASGVAGTAIQVLDFTLDPIALSVPAGTVALAVTNDGPTVHNVKVRDDAGMVLFGTADLREGASETTSGKLEPGEYVMFCSLAGHESLGIKGTLTVTAP